MPTDQKVKKQQVGEAMTQIELTVENSHDAIIGKNIDGIITSWNGGATRMFGYTAEETIGKSILILFPPELKDELPILLNKIKSGEVIVDYNTMRVRKDGIKIDVSLSIAPIKKANGVVIGASVVEREITRKKREEEVMRQIQLIVDNSYDAIIGETFDGIITSWNGGATRMFGYTAEEVIGKSILQMLPAEMKNELPQQLNRIKKGEVIANYDTIRIRKDGSRINVAISMSPVKNEDGKLVGASVVERDITIRKKSEESMRQIQLVVDNSYDALIGTDLKGVITTWSGGAERMFGYTQIETIGKSSEMLNPPEIKKEVQIMLDKVATGNPVVDYDSIRMRKDGTKFDVSFSTSAIQTKDGTVIGISSVIRDNTVRKKSEESMRQIQLVVDNSYDALIGETLDGIITTWNSGAERMLGYKSSEIVGKSILTLYTPEGKEELAKLLGKIKSGEAVIDHDSVRVHKDGTKIDITLTISPIKDKIGTITGASIVYRNITRRKKEEEVLRQIQLIVDNSSDAIISTTLDGVITSWNKGAERMFGYTALEVIGKSGSTLFPPEMWEKVPALLKKVEKKEATVNYYTAGLRKDRTIFDMAISISPTLNKEGDVIGASVIERDISERMKAERHIIELSDIRNKFIEIMSHQLRTPLTSINWSLESILNGDYGKLEDVQQKFLQATHSASTEITRRIGNLLSAMDIEEGRMKYDTEDVDLTSLCAGIANEAKRKSASKDLVFSYTPPTSILPVIKGDNEKIRIAINMLIENAIGYTKEKGKINMLLSTKGGVAHMEVKDTGIGVPKAEQASVFNRFFRASNSSVMQTDAFGIGLFIAKNFVEQHHGKIGFESIEGTGSTFWIEIPFKNEPSKL